MECRWVSADLCSPQLGLGANCGFGMEPCEPGLVCATNIAGGTCQPVPAEGAPCVERSCQPGLGCNLYQGICQAPAAEGAPCNYGPMTVQCAPGLACSDPGQLDGSGICQAVSGTPCCAGRPTCAAAEALLRGGRVPHPGRRGRDLRRGDALRGERLVRGVVLSPGRRRGRRVLKQPHDVPRRASRASRARAPATAHCQTPTGAGQVCEIDGRCAAGNGCQWTSIPDGRCEPAFCAAETTRVAM